MNGTEYQDQAIVLDEVRRVVLPRPDDDEFKEKRLTIATYIQLAASGLRELADHKAGKR
jgi:hypothetical protein